MSRSSGTFPAEALLRRLVSLMPASFRERRGRDLIECHRDLWQAAEGGRGPLRRVRFGLRAVLSTLVAVVALWGRTVGSDERRHGEAGMGRDRWIQDGRLAVRRLIRRPAFSLAVVLTLGLGLGANTAVFSVLHAVLVAPLPFEDGDRLVRIYGRRIDQPGQADRLYLPTPGVLELRTEVPSLASVAVLQNYSAQGVDVSDGDRPERLRLLRVNADYFRTLGVTPVVGRVFERSEEAPDASAAVVTESVWQRYLGGRTDAMGESLTLDGTPVRVVGVVGDALVDPLEGRIDVWMPVDLATEAGYWDNNWLTAVGRLADGASFASLRSELDVLESRHADSEDAFEKGYAEVSLREDMVGAAEPLLLAVMGAVFFLLLLTAVNVASLLMTHAAGRERESAIRTSLGSPRSSLIRQFMLEALLLSVAGAGAGLLLGTWALHLILSMAPADLPLADTIGMSPAGLGFTAAAALVLGLVLGLATALPFSRPDPSATSGSRGQGEGTSRPVLRAFLVRVEVALAVVLLVGAGILLKTTHRLQTRDIGADPGGVLTFEVGLPDVRYGSDTEIHAFSERFHERVRAIPGVVAAGTTSRLPVTGRYNTFGTRRAHGPDDPMPVDNTGVNQRWIAGDYFGVVGLDLVAGRVFDVSDRADGPYRTVVNQMLVDRLFGDEDALGQWIVAGGRYTQIVGVVENEALTARSSPEPIAYHHQRQWISGNREMTQVVRVAGDPASVLPALRQALTRVDPDLVLHDPRPLGEVIGDGMATERFATTLLAVFAGLALAVAGLGLYGVLSHYVGRQRHEIAVRMALGADRRGVVDMVLRRAVLLAVGGAAAGVVLALGLASALEFLVYEVSPRDPLVLGAAPVILLAVAALASWIPAMRATRVDPAASFRSD